MHSPFPSPQLQRLICLPKKDKIHPCLLSPRLSSSLEWMSSHHQFRTQCLLRENPQVPSSQRPMLVTLCSFTPTVDSFHCNLPTPWGHKHSICLDHCCIYNIQDEVCDRNTEKCWLGMCTWKGQAAQLKRKDPNLGNEFRLCSVTMNLLEIYVFPLFGSLLVRNTTTNVTWRGKGLFHLNPESQSTEGSQNRNSNWTGKRWCRRLLLIGLFLVAFSACFLMPLGTQTLVWHYTQWPGPPISITH